MVISGYKVQSTACIGQTASMECLLALLDLLTMGDGNSSVSQNLALYSLMHNNSNKLKWRKNIFIGLFVKLVICDELWYKWYLSQKS